MSKTTDFILNNPGQNFDGSNYFDAPQNEPAYLSLSDWQGMTKAEIASQAKTLVDVILETGGADKAAERLSAMAEFVEKVRKDEKFIDAVCTEVERNGGKVETASGAKIEKMEAAPKYHFENTGDIMLAAMEKELAELTEKVKKRKEFLKCIDTKGEVITDPETGETFTAYPPYKTSSTTYKVTLKR